MTIGGELQSNKNITEQEKEKIQETFQANENGISGDYYNKSMMIGMDSKTLLNRPGFELANSPYSEEVLRKRVQEKMKTFPSYSEYMASKGKINGLGLTDFLTKKGKEIVKRLDEIAVEIRGLAVEDCKAIDLERLLILLVESKKLIYEE